MKPQLTQQAPPAAPEWFGQPRGLTILFLTDMWEQFSYYGMRAILVKPNRRAARLCAARAPYPTYLSRARRACFHGILSTFGREWPHVHNAS